MAYVEQRPTSEVTCENSLPHLHKLAGDQLVLSANLHKYYPIANPRALTTSMCTLATLNLSLQLFVFDHPAF